MIVLPLYLGRLQQRFGAEGENQPYINVATSLILAGILVLLAYANNALVAVSAQYPRAGPCPWPWA